MTDRVRGPVREAVSSDRLEWTIEPERYELIELASARGGVATDRVAQAVSLPDRLPIDRRVVLKLFAAMGGGLVVVATMPAPLAQESGRGGGQRSQTPTDLASWLHIDSRGRITAYTGKVEIGQNIRTSLAQVIADELCVSLSAISLVMADTDLTPYDQGTFGSQTTPRMAPVLARAAATAREMLFDQAARMWSVPRRDLRAVDGRIEATDGRAIPFGELTQGRKLVGTASVEPAAAAAWRLRGTAARKVNGRGIVTGAHLYTPDLARPGMLIGRVLRPPAYLATMRRVDDAGARAIAGVTVVRQGDFIGVVAPNERAAARAADAIRIDWNDPPPQPSSETIYRHLTRGLMPGGGTPRVRGDVDSARVGAARVIEATYQIPYIAHVPLEPRAAVAEWSQGKLTVWTGTQRPFGVRAELMTAFGLSEPQVRVIVPDMGSGYGGKHTGEQAIEAARLARAAGRPVKLVYTRAEEFAWGYLRPAGVIEVIAGVDAAGRLISWQFTNWNSGASGLPTPYAVANAREEFRQSPSALRQGSYRGLAATANHFAREMHMDAIARALGVDAVEFRLRHLDASSPPAARMRAVLTTAAEKCGWPRPSRADRALGIACGTEKGSYIATAAEVAKAPGGFSVERLVVVFECGAIVNPDGLRNQVEGAIVQGLGGALFEAVRFAGGRILNGTMRSYRVPRFRDVPPIDIVLVDRPDLPSAGAGETPIVCGAPAIGRAARTFGRVDDCLPVALRR
jgi:isoquinoline 1-oxidoreductase